MKQYLCPILNAYYILIAHQKIICLFGTLFSKSGFSCGFGLNQIAVQLTRFWPKTTIKRSFTGYYGLCFLLTGCFSIFDCLFLLILLLFSRVV
jgi:hypothetical protein